MGAGIYTVSPARAKQENHTRIAVQSLYYIPVGSSSESTHYDYQTLASSLGERLFQEIGNPMRDIFSNFKYCFVS